MGEEIVKQYQVFCNDGHGLVPTDYLSDPPVVCPLNVAHTIDVGQTTVLDVVVSGEPVPNIETKSLDQYRVYCQDEGINVQTEGYKLVEPTLCPNDDTHVIDPNFTVVIGHIDETAVNERTIIVSKNKGNASTIAGGIALLNALVPPVSMAAPARLLVDGGQYVEVNPLVIPDFAVVKGYGVFHSTIVGTVPGQPVVKIGSYVEVNDIVIAAGAPGIEGIEIDGVGTNFLNNIIVQDCQTGVRHIGGKTVITESLIRSVNIPVTNGILVENGSTLSTSLTSVRNFGQPVTNGLYTQDPGTTTIFSDFRITGVTNAIVVNTESVTKLSSGNIDGSETPLTINDASVVNIMSVNMTNVSGCDVKITHADAILFANALSYQGKIDNSIGAKVYGSFINQEEKNQGVEVIGRLAVGKPNFPTESTFGEGDVTTMHMKVCTDNSGVFTDKTADAIATDGVTFDAFDDNQTNSALYIGSDFKFPGLIMCPTGTISGGSVILEYWDGGAWSFLPVMITDTIEPYETHAQQYFQHAGSNYDYKFGWAQGWDTTVVNGDDLFWVRFRITSNLVASPTIDNIFLDVNRTIIREGGFLEKSGSGRSISMLNWTINDANNFGSSPFNQDFYYSPNIGKGNIENGFANGVVDRVGNNFKAPFDIDTAYPIIFRWEWKSSTTVGEVTWRLTWGYSEEGDVIANSSASAPALGPNGQAKQRLIDIASPATANAVVTSMTYLDFHDVISNTALGTSSTLWITLSRVGNHPNDTNNGSVYLLNISPFYVTWKLGGSLAGFFP